jgi:hypothetical protein
MRHAEDGEDQSFGFAPDLRQAPLIGAGREWGAKAGGTALGTFRGEGLPPPPPISRERLLTAIVLAVLVYGTAFAGIWTTYDRLTAWRQSGGDPPEALPALARQQAPADEQLLGGVGQGGPLTPDRSRSEQTQRALQAIIEDIENR